MHRLAILSLCLSLGCSSATEADLEPFQLENGLQVILKPLPSAPHVALVVLFDIGGDHDPSGQSGLAHAVEHLYVTAAAGTTPARTVREYALAHPHGWNAQTGDDYTVIASVFDVAELDDELKEAAERMQSLRVTDADLDREKPRILDELHNMYAGITKLAANNRARELVHPSAEGHRKGGVSDDVSKLTAADVQARWERYYKPNNARLVLAGDFDALYAKRKIQALFSQVEPGDSLPAALKRPEAVHAEPLKVATKAEQRSSRARVCLAYKAPSTSDGMFPAFLILVAKMQSRTAQLRSGPRDFPVQFMAIDDPSVLYVTSEVQDGETAEQTIERLDRFVLDVANEDVTRADRQLTLNAFTFFYETSELPAAAMAGNIYGVAFGLARRQQLGIEPAQMKESILNAPQDAIDRCRKQVFAVECRAAVVVSE